MQPLVAAFGQAFASVGASTWSQTMVTMDLCAGMAQRRGRLLARQKPALLQTLPSQSQAYQARPIHE
eukprot:8685696-Pyramimonas_sp.AAC.1